MVTVYEVNTPTTLASLGPTAQLDDDLLPFLLSKLTALFRPPARPPHYVYLLGLWQVSDAGLAKSFAVLDGSATPPPDPESAASPMASPFCIASYSVRPEWGGNPALTRLRSGLWDALGVAVMADFVPNHFAVDHPDTLSSPHLFVSPAAAGAAPAPVAGASFATRDGVVLVHGRDPFFPPWTDTVQLDYSEPDTVRLMTDTLVAVAGLVDAVRVDMAMLVLADVFGETWPSVPRPPSEFWAEAIPAVRAAAPDTVLLAEAYWGTQARLQDLGFDFTYDKDLYDALIAKDGCAVSTLLGQASGSPAAAHFIENHDEPRAATALGSTAAVRPALALIASLPGMLFLHDGQAEGETRQRSMHSSAAMHSALDPALFAFSRAVFSTRAYDAIQAGSLVWAGPLDISPSSDGDPSAAPLVAVQWNAQLPAASSLAPVSVPAFITLVNLGDTQAHGYVHAAVHPTHASRHWILIDELAPGTAWDRVLGESHGFWVQLPPHGAHILEIVDADVFHTTLRGTCGTTSASK